MTMSTKQQTVFFSPCEYIKLEKGNCPGKQSLL